MTWTADSSVVEPWAEQSELVPEGICVAGLLIPGQAIAGVGFGFWSSEDAAVTTMWSG